jgi:hypothetical protein
MKVHYSCSAVLGDFLISLLAGILERDRRICPSRCRSNVRRIPRTSVTSPAATSSERSLEDLKVALQQFHQYRTVFSGTVRPDGLAGFSLPRQHSLVHYHDNIKNFGSPNGLCSSITESKHIVAVKRPWRRSSRYKALSQILKVNERLDKLAAARADFAARGMLTNPPLVAAILDVPWEQQPQR